MSSIQGVQRVSSSDLLAAQAATKAPAAKTESAAQEAQETVAVTKAEAGKGDQQAIRKMTQLQVASGPKKTEPAATPPAGTGGNINMTA